MPFRRERFRGQALLGRLVERVEHVQHQLDATCATDPDRLRGSPTSVSGCPKACYAVLRGQLPKSGGYGDADRTRRNPRFEVPLVTSPLPRLPTR